MKTCKEIKINKNRKIEKERLMVTLFIFVCLGNFVRFQFKPLRKKHQENNEIIQLIESRVLFVTLFKTNHRNVLFNGLRE
jgi:hypothetical protein